MPIPTRGVKEIRTQSGKVNRVSIPYKAYMQITCLEMERARRESEGASARRRIANIEARLAEIEVEKAALLQSVGERAGRIAAPASPLARGNIGRPGFKIKY